VPGPHRGLIWEPVEQPPKAGPLGARIVIVGRATDLPNEQQIASDQDPPGRLVDHQVVRAVPRHVKELVPGPSC
jgi:hypothetical protein